MNKTVLSIFSAAILLGSVSLAAAQSTTTTSTSTWTNDQGRTITDYSTSQKYSSFNDPALKPVIGMEMPGTVTVYPLPSTVTVTTPERYSYGIVNNQPVVIERTTRKVVHTWQ